MYGVIVNISSREEKLQKIIEIEKILNDIQDIDVLLEQLLTEARSIVNADAGSIYVWDEDTKLLSIKYSQNDTQQKRLAPGQKLPYSFFSFPVNEKSISGYCVLNKEILNIPDVYEIPEDSIYKFNRQPDLLSGYQTKSMLRIPLITADGRILGVLQIINAQDEEGNFIAFDKDAELYIQHFAENATAALERTYLTRAMVLRMARMAEMRDPKETGTHVTRVSKYSVEIYDRWAFKHNIPQKERSVYRDSLSIASMLHDVGKVGISDLILKKPGRFDDTERNIIKAHTYICLFLFKGFISGLDKMTLDVALHHHERWDGKGYPGKIDAKKITSPDVILDLQDAPGLLGNEIPLAARIVAVADVFDALSHRRCYKDAWNEEDVLNELKKQSGTQFDPEIIDVFFEVYPTIKDIQNSLPDEES